MATTPRPPRVQEPDWDAIHEWRMSILQPYLDAGLVQFDDRDGRGGEIFYRSGQLVVAETDVPRFLALDVVAGLDFAETDDVFVPLPENRRDGGPASTRLAQTSPVDDGGERFDAATLDLPRTHRVFQLATDFDVPDLVRRIRAEHVEGGPVAVGPNHMVTGLQRRIGWPSVDPELSGPLPRMRRVRKHPDAGAGIRVAILDTGFPAGHLPKGLDWFDHDTSWWSLPGEPAHVDEVDGAPANGFLDAEAGHALFIGGLIRRLAPKAHLVFLKCLNSDGLGTGAGVATAIGWAVARRPHIIGMSLGGYTLGNEASIGETAAISQARAQLPGLAILAAAGNDGVTSMAYPAGLKHVVAVGALDATQKSVAATSNRGPWVDVYAPGTGLTSSYVLGQEEPGVPPLEPGDTEGDDFRNGAATWSGTSFATAMVAGVLARSLSPKGAPVANANPARRLDRLIEKARAKAAGGDAHITVAASTYAL